MYYLIASFSNIKQSFILGGKLQESFSFVYKHFSLLVCEDGWHKLWSQMLIKDPNSYCRTCVE